MDGTKEKCQWQEESMQLALESVSEGMIVTEAARIFQIPAPNLKRSGKPEIRPTRWCGRPSELTPEEKILVDYITFISKW